MDADEERTSSSIFERKIFRRIYGAKYENGEWKSRTNRELDEMSKAENIVKWIKGQRISWLGHLERMEEDRMPKRSSLKNWKGREEGEDPGEDGKSWWQIGKNGRTLFDRSKPTVGCSANGRRSKFCLYSPNRYSTKPPHSPTAHCQNNVIQSSRPHKFY